MTTNKSVGVFECATGNSDRLQLCRFAGYHVDGRTIRKQVHHVEARMEYYWELRSKNAQNIKALICPLYKQERKRPTPVRSAITSA